MYIYLIYIYIDISYMYKEEDIYKKREKDTYLYVHICIYYLF